MVYADFQWKSAGKDSALWAAFRENCPFLALLCGLSLGKEEREERGEERLSCQLSSVECVQCEKTDLHTLLSPVIYNPENGGEGQEQGCKEYIFTSFE